MRVRTQHVTIVEDRDVQIRVDEYSGRIEAYRVIPSSPDVITWVGDITQAVLRVAKRRIRIAETKERAAVRK